MSEKISFMFADQKYRLGELLIDAVIKETHELRANISEHPTEKGESFCDHVQTMPIHLQIEGIISSTPLTMIGTSVLNSLISDVQNLADAAYKKLEDIFLKREPITIATTLKEYPDMVLESLTVERGGGFLSSLHFKASAKQIRQVNQKLIDLPAPKVERAKPKQNMGKQETKVLEGEQDHKKSSLLRSLFSSFSDMGR